MKNGKRPSVRQKKLMAAWGLNPADWLVVKDTSTELELIHRNSDTTRRMIPKGDKL